MNKSMFIKAAAILAAITLMVCCFVAAKADTTTWEKANENATPLAVTVDADGGVMEYYASGIAVGSYEEVAAP